MQFACLGQALLRKKALTLVQFFPFPKPLFAGSREDLGGTTICVMPAREPETLKQNITFSKHNFLKVKLYFFPRGRSK
jgi:hypothetical protein